MESGAGNIPVPEKGSPSVAAVLHGPIEEAPRTVEDRARARARKAHALQDSASPFRSYWLGGYHTEHHTDDCTGSALLQDYQRILEFGIASVREKALWSGIDRGGFHHLHGIETRAAIAASAGIQIVWTLYTRPWPNDVPFFSARFVERFGRYAKAMAECVTQVAPEFVPVFAPINEITFEAWQLYSKGKARRLNGTRPSPGEVRHQLVRAALAASQAILEVAPHARLLHADPLEHVVAPLDRPDLQEEAARRCELQFGTWDLLCGRGGRDLGGQPRYLDLVGVNYYAENQWEVGSGKRLAWQMDDARRLPLSSLLKRAHARYGRPLVIAETSHNGVRRGTWVREIATEVRDAARIGIPVEGICIDPIIDQRDLESGQWLRRGLWELQPGGDLAQSPDASYATALRMAQRITDDRSIGNDPGRHLREQLA